MAAIIIRRADLEIEVQDAVDLRAVLEALGERQLTLPLDQASSRNGRHNPRPVTATPTDEAFRRFYKLTVGKSTQRFIDALYQKSNGLTDTQARQLLGFTKNLELAGVSSAIVKSERKAGLPDHSAVSHTRKGKVGDYTYLYRLMPACRQALESVIAHTQNGEAPA